MAILSPPRFLAEPLAYLDMKKNLRKLDKKNKQS